MDPGPALITLTLQTEEIKGSEDGNQSLSICALHHIPDSLWNKARGMRGTGEDRGVVKEVERERDGGETKGWNEERKDWDNSV